MNAKASFSMAAQVLRNPMSQFGQSPMGVHTDMLMTFPREIIPG